jgi:two-component system phosphate regulon sensor histidine kinase PhoR
LGIDMSYLALPVRQNDQTIALVRTAMELDTINRRVAALRWFLWLFALIVGLIAAALTYTVVGRVIRPLTDLTASAQAIASGDEDQLVRVEGKDETAQLANAFGQMHDELVRRAGQSRENRDQMATVLGSMSEGIIAVDASEKIILANQASRALLGLSADNVEGRRLIEAVRIHALYQTVEAARKDGQSRQAEFETSDKPRRVLSVRATCLPGDPSPGIVIVLHDVTELRRLENLRYNLFANVSHELKTPLAAIKASAETLRLGAINDAQHNLGFVACIEEQAERLHQLILDMLHIARIESGQESFDITHVNVADVVEACRKQAAHKVQLNEITLAIRPPDDSLRVRADKDGLRIILENLLDNAIKYTPPGGQVTVEWELQDATIVLRVKDTGIGIAADDQSRIFERFFRVDKARSREIGGTGLGLSIVKHLCQAFGGSVDLQSTSGQGSIFTVKLPVSDAVEPAVGAGR